MNSGRLPPPIRAGSEKQAGGARPALKILMCSVRVLAEHFFLWANRRKAHLDGRENNANNEI